MDAVEIVMEVEDAFGIQIESSEAEKIVTPAQLIELVLLKIAVVQSLICLSQRSFYLLRGWLTRNFGIERKRIAPNVRLEQLIKKTDRLGFLTRIAEELQTGPLPDLVRPGWIYLTLFLTSLGCALLAMVLLWSHIPPSVTSVVTAVIVGCFGALLTRRFCTEFPKPLATIGDFSIWIVAHKPGIADNAPIGWTREQVALRVREIVVDVLGCEGSYHENARFVEDLAMG